MADPQDLIVQIRAAFRTGQYEVSRHAGVRMLRRVIRSGDIEEAIAGAEIIETYPDDKYGPSVLSSWDSPVPDVPCTSRWRTSGYGS
jgi:hypothetical protein